MNWYMVLIKIDPNHTDEAVDRLRKFPKKPTRNIFLHGAYYVFGNWDACLWFEAEAHDDAMNFLQQWVRPIPWITESYAMPTTTIKEYWAKPTPKVKPKTKARSKPKRNSKRKK